jgi:hypothetical protein
MNKMKLIGLAALITFGFLAACAVPVSEQSVTAYERARLIVGDGRVIENATLVVQDAKLAQVGRAVDVRVPAGARRVDLAGKTVMPMIVDTHVHLSETREALIRDLRQRAYYGVSAALSMGTDGYDLLDLRNQEIPGAARFRSAGRGITTPEPGRTTVPYWITTAAEGRKAVAEIAANKADIVKIWVDDRDGKYKKLTPECMALSLTRRTSGGCGSPRTSSRSRMRRDLCVPGWTCLRTVSATRTLMRNW